MRARVRWRESQRFARFGFAFLVSVEKVEHCGKIRTRFHMRWRKLQYAPIRQLCIGNAPRRLQRTSVAVPHQTRIRIKCCGTL